MKARTAILDGEIVALDDQGRPSFSLMQQRTGVGEGGRRIRRTRDDIPVVYYVFDLLYLDGYDLMQADLELRKQLLARSSRSNDLIRYSDHYVGQGTALFEAAAQRGLEGIVAKRRSSCYFQKRSSEWLKIKVVKAPGVRHRRLHRSARRARKLRVAGAGFIRRQGPADPVGQAGSGFTEQTHEQMWKRLHALDTNHSPFFGKVESDRRVHFVKPELVAEIKFTEWTHEGQSGGIKMRAPVFQGLRFDKKPKECKFEFAASAEKEVKKAESGRGNECRSRGSLIESVMVPVGRGQNLRIDSARVAQPNTRFIHGLNCRLLVARHDFAGVS